MKDGKLPEGWKKLSLGEILTGQQCAEVERLCDKHGHDTLELTWRLKDYYNTIETDLRRQEIYPEFLAYATVFAYEQSRPQNSKKGKQ